MMSLERETGNERQGRWDPGEWYETARIIHLDAGEIYRQCLCKRYGQLCLSEEDEFFAVILDWKMPGMDGLETLKADVFAADIRRPRSAGMNGRIAKPIDVHRLTKVLRDWTEQERIVAEAGYRCPLLAFSSI